MVGNKNTILFGVFFIQMLYTKKQRSAGHTFVKQPENYKISVSSFVYIKFLISSTFIFLMISRLHVYIVTIQYLKRYNNQFYNYVKNIDISFIQKPVWSLVILWIIYSMGNKKKSLKPLRPPKNIDWSSLILCLIYAFTTIQNIMNYICEFWWNYCIEIYNIQMWSDPKNHL